MIFRRRRTRIEIEHTTVKVKAGDPAPVDLTLMTVTPPSLPAESSLGPVLPSPAHESTEANAQPSATTIDGSPARKIPT